MTPAERALWLRLQRRTSNLQPEMSAAISKAFEIIRAQMTESELLRAIQSGSIDQIFEKALSDAVLQQSFQPVRDQMRENVNKGVLYFSRDIKVPKTVTFAFDSLNPDVIEAVKQLESRVITDLTDSVKDTVRARVLSGIADGETATSIARDLRNVVGLGPSQLQEVENYRDALNGINGRKITDYTLRDKRFKAGADIAPEQVDRMVARYTERRIAANADTVARTAVLDSQKLGQSLSIDQAVKQGILDGARTMKRWVGVMDSRERDEHVAMEGETVPYDEPYSNGEDIPGESTYNCRCISRFTQRTQ